MAVAAKEWHKVLLHFYRNYPFGIKMEAYDLLTDEHPVVRELNMPMRDIFDIIERLRTVKLMRLGKFDSFSQGREGEGYIVNITEKGFDVAMHLEEHIDAERNNKVISVLTLVIAFATIIQVANEVFSTYIQGLFLVQLSFLLSLFLFAVMAYKTAKQNMFLKD